MPPVNFSPSENYPKNAFAGREFSPKNDQEIIATAADDAIEVNVGLKHSVIAVDSYMYAATNPLHYRVKSSSRL